MIDLKVIKDDPARIRDEVKKRGGALDVDALVEADEARRRLQQEIDAARAAQKRTTDRAKGKALKDKLKKLEAEATEAQSRFEALYLQVPNFSTDDVPVAPDESGNEEIRQVGEKPSLENPAQHFDIPAITPHIDFVRGAKVSGSRFWYLKGPLVDLEFALIRYALDFYREKGFVPMRPPTIVNRDAMEGTGFFPADENEIYTVEDETGKNTKKYLVGTAEVALASYHAGESLEELPVKYIGFSPAYRREAGSYGKDTKGIIRGHEFDKLELFVFAAPDQSAAVHDELQANAEEFWSSLGIPFRVVNIATGDLGAPNAKKLDIEAWLPGEGQYREVASNSNDTDFQARRLGIKHQGGLAHTLNNTAVAIGRAIVAIVENYQRKDGTVGMPEKLHEYLPFKEIKNSD